MLKKFWILILMCTTGWMCIVLGSTWEVPVTFQILLLIIGLLLSMISTIPLIKYLLSNKNT